MESVPNPSHHVDRYPPVEETPMADVVVAGHLMVEPENRDDYLSICVEVVRQARASAGCLDFAISADLVDPGRINVYERWNSQSAVEAFRGSGPSDEQGVATISASVAEFDVAGQRSLT
jgi:quinol monooxygenase YgiN